MPAGAIPMPFRPNLMGTGLCTFAPSCGAMKYTSAPAGAALRSAATANAAIKDTPNANSRRLMGLSSFKDRSLQLRGRIHDHGGHGEAENDRINEEKHNPLEQGAEPAAAEHAPHGHYRVNG